MTVPNCCYFSLYSSVLLNFSFGAVISAGLPQLLACVKYSVLSYRTVSSQTKQFQQQQQQRRGHGTIMKILPTDRKMGYNTLETYRIPRELQ